MKEYLIIGVALIPADTCLGSLECSRNPDCEMEIEELSPVDYELNDYYGWYSSSDDEASDKYLKGEAQKRRRPEEDKTPDEPQENKKQKR